ncbi:AAA-domain-containing protein [Aaosphaeria arxii CBS 175.79]|uniref:AAA-domain-containing protein n=1 Tax=Aaosphaeria arxii CBS 175.79 TaxID=1450172 RepID=A0A6A5Y9Q3_9PLEO|nr:AAA-domain-containing protein [Aaosphaeria arxii CBS 175.79]KAF2021953.1 AAA-domain-containing protein [Aaosphaeria arxii CBS 175.79]
MSNRTKRKFDIDPNASDPEDLDYDATERRATPHRRRHRPTSSSNKRGTKRARRTYAGSDVDDDDEIVSDDSFTDRSESEVEINPSTGRSVRRATKKQIKYEESDDDAIQDSDSDSEGEGDDHDELGSPVPQRKSKKSLIVKLKMSQPTPARHLRARTGSKSIAPRGRTPEVTGQRRSSRLSQDVEEPIVALSDSGKHVTVVRQGTRSPEPMIAARTTRGGKGPPAPEHSIIMEASQEASMVQHDDDDDAGPLDTLLGGGDTQVEASHEVSPDPTAQAHKDEDESDEEMKDVIQESQQDAAAEDSDDDEPITRSGRNLRSRGKSAKRKTAADESSDFEPAGDDEKDEEEMSESDSGKNKRKYSEDSESGSPRKSTRTRAKSRRSQRSRRNSESSDQDSILDPDELAEEAEELTTTKRRRLRRNPPDSDLAYDAAPKLRDRARNTVDYRLIRPELNTMFDEEEGAAAAAAGRSRPKAGGRAVYRSLFNSQGPFGGGIAGGPNNPGAVGGIDSDSSDDDGPKASRAVGGAIGMTPTAASAPGFGVPQTHNADPQQTTGGGSGGGPANFGKVQDKKALADSDPLGVDPTVNFDGVGGLDDHINKLKEMVMLPLLYPEVFQRFKITPPRGVLFHGPPGTGKTLLARALASSVSSHGQKVTFYMRKGADALSKWVGEAERQLRLLFEEARKTQPSIIFFDEIDGLAPVRSSKQEQIHASIVATLLALMDGMDGRGQVIVIGATNRPDSVDPALRRPGRFDREFYFPLPNLSGRRAIIDIHTKNWEPPLKPSMKDQLADLTKGYGGADLRALCTEAALNAVQGTYPQIYQSERKLLIDPTTIKVLAKDFMISVNKMVPSSQRTVTAKAAPLGKLIEPLLRKPLEEVMKRIDELIPRRKKLTALEEAQFDDREDEKGFEREATLREFETGRVFRPRLLINGLQGMGQQYLGAAILNRIEGLHVQSFDLPTIYEDPTRTPEAAITQLFTEVRRHKPSVIYIPDVNVWYDTLAGTQAIKTFKLLLRSISANEPILLLAVMELADEKEKLDTAMMEDLFPFSKNNQYFLQRPDQQSREEFFTHLLQYVRMSPTDIIDPDNRKKRTLPELEAAPIVTPVVDPKDLAAMEKAQKKQDRLTLNKLKVAIQPIMDQLKRQYRRFFKPIIDEQYFAYLLVESDPNTFGTDLSPEEQQEQGVQRPWEYSTDSKGYPVLLHVESGNKYYNLDLKTIEERLSNGYYTRPKDFLFDIKTLAKDARTYGDPERTLKTNEMQANVEVDIEVISSNHPGLAQECEAVYKRQQDREAKLKAKATAEGKESAPTAETAAAPEAQPSTTTDESGPIRLGEPIPGQSAIPPVTPSRAVPPSGPLSNGTSLGGNSNAQTNGSTVPSRPEEDTHMTDSQDLNTQNQHEFQTPSRVGTQTQPYTQTQKSQVSGQTHMAPDSHPGEYHNSASTTTSGQKTSDRSSGAKMNTQSSNGVGPSGVPDFYEMMPQAGGSQLPDTQGSSLPHHQAHSSSFSTDSFNFEEVQYQSSVPSNSQYSPSSQPPNPMPAPAIPRHSTNIASLLNDESEKTQPALLIDEDRLVDLHQSLVRKTSGLSVEQLEQVNACLMDTIWHARSEWNRNIVSHNVADAFNKIIHDIEEMQTLLKPSQTEALYSQALPHTQPGHSYPYSTAQAVPWPAEHSQHVAPVERQPAQFA